MAFHEEAKLRDRIAGIRQGARGLSMDLDLVDVLTPERLRDDHGVAARLDRLFGFAKAELSDIESEMARMGWLSEDDD